MIGDKRYDSTVAGRGLRQLRRARGKTLEVVAGLAGISPSYLYRLEAGERSLDRLSTIVVLAQALQIAPSELITLQLSALGVSDPLSITRGLAPYWRGD
ncbi:MAG: helix-turn-helix domain-containing protein [Pseudonocardiaceae bacterium]